MRIRLRKQPGTEASVLFVALGLASLLILFMYYYLNLMRAQNVAVARSQAWNGAMAAAEAGVEEALAHLHLNPGVPLPLPNDRLSTNGWGDPDSVTGFYGPQTRSLPGGSSYSVIFSNGTQQVTIISTGSVAVAAIPATLTRVVQVVATPTPLFTTAMATKSDFNMDLPDVVVPNANWLQPTPSQQNVTVNGTNYDYGFTRANPGSVSYSTIPSSGSFSIFVGTNVNLRLKLTGNSPTLDGLRVAGSTANSGSLVIYTTGVSLTVDGITTVDSGSATNFSLFATSTTTNITLNGDSSFVGTIYAPSADLTLNGGGHDNDHDGGSDGSVGFTGASISKSVITNGNYSFQFDGFSQFQRGYLVTSWREL